MDTACSASLVAAHVAAVALRNLECTAGALAGGVNLIIAPETYTVLSAASLLSSAGRCRTLDASGDGYGRGEACISYMLQPGSVWSGNHEPVAIFAGSAVNQDGLSSSLTAPNGPAQQAVMAKVGGIMRSKCFSLQALLHWLGSVVSK